MLFDRTQPFVLRSVPSTIPVHFYGLRGAGALFANNQSEIQERRFLASQGTLTTAY